MFDMTRSKLWSPGAVAAWWRVWVTAGGEVQNALERPVPAEGAEVGMLYAVISLGGVDALLQRRAIEMGPLETYSGILPDGHPAFVFVNGGPRHPDAAKALRKASLRPVDFRRVIDGFLYTPPDRASLPEV